MVQMSLQSIMVYLAFVLGLTVSIMSARAQTLPDKPPFTQLVELNTGPGGIELESALRTVSKAVNVPLLTRNLPRERVIFQGKRSFGDMVRLLVTIYAPGYAYAWLPEKILLIAPQATLASLVPRTTPQPPPQATLPKEQSAAATATVAIPVPYLGRESQEVAKTLNPKLTPAYIEKATLLILQGDPEQLASVTPLIREAEERAQAKQQKQQTASTDQAKPTDTPAKPPLEWRKYILGNATDAQLEELSKAANQLGADQVVIIANSKTLMVKATAEVHQLLAPLTEIKENPPPPKPLTARHIFKLGGQDVLAGLKTLFPNLEIVSLGAETYAAKGTPEAITELQHFLEDKKTLEFTPSDQSKEKADTPPLYLKGYEIYGNPKEIEAALSQLFTKDLVQISVLPEARKVVVRGPIEAHRAVVNLLKNIDPPKKNPVASNGNGKARARIALSHISEEQLQAFLEDYGLKVEVLKEPTGGVIWLQGERKELEKALGLLPYVDRPAPQTRLQVRVVQVSKTEFSQLGNEIQSALAGTNLNLSAGAINLTYTIPAPLANLLNLKINALENAGNARTLVDSELTAKDKTAVKLRSGGSLVAQNTSNNNQNNQQPATTIANVDYGMTLEFKPTIRGGNQPSVEIEATVELGDLPRTGPANTIDIPKRSLQATFRLGSGETALLGGLIQENSNQGKQGIPFLSQIPIIGWLFGSSENTTRSDVLLIFTKAVAIDAPLAQAQIMVENQPEIEEIIPDTREPPTVPTTTGPQVPPMVSTASDQQPDQKATTTTPSQPPAAPSPAPPNPLLSGNLPNAPVATWVTATKFVTARGVAIYLRSQPHAPIATPIHVYAVSDNNITPVVYRRLTERLTSAGALVLDIVTQGKESDRFIVFMEDELGGIWRVEAL